MDSKGRNVIVCDNGTGVSRKCEKKNNYFPGSLLLM